MGMCSNDDINFARFQFPFCEFFFLLELLNDFIIINGYRKIFACSSWKPEMLVLKDGCRNQYCSLFPGSRQVLHVPHCHPVSSAHISALHQPVHWEGSFHIIFLPSVTALFWSVSSYTKAEASSSVLYCNYPVEWAKPFKLLFSLCAYNFIRSVAISFTCLCFFFFKPVPYTSPPSLFILGNSSFPLPLYLLIFMVEEILTYKGPCLYKLCAQLPATSHWF